MGQENVCIGVIGLGYVGLPLALAFARKFEKTVGFDIDPQKISALKQGVDPTCEGLEITIKESNLLFTDKEDSLCNCNFFIIGVPTPVDSNHNPDLTALKLASEIVGRNVKKGAFVVYESTVYPGVTEEFCGPIIAKTSKLKQGVDFKLGYSPERMNPGDKAHTLETIVKVVSGEDKETLEIVADVYSQVVKAGVHRASSIKVAEAAKVIENTQRDLNIALMNELSIIFDKLEISTKEVIDAAATKWNFMRFTPGLVGGHCIGVDPYYLTTKAEQLGYHPQVILAGRRINDGMGVYVAQRLIKLMVTSGLNIKGSKIGILGLTFKENVSDIRNSRVPDIVKELRAFGAEVLIHDPYVKTEHARHEYDLTTVDWKEIRDLDGLVFAVPHKVYLDMELSKLLEGLKSSGVVIDVKSALDRKKIPTSMCYWSL